jgi:protein phosphatase
MLEAHGLTHVGRIRHSNEDAFVMDREIGLYLVADGMGGHNAGEVAAQLVVDTMRAFLVRSQHGEDCTWPYGIDPRLSFDANRLRTAMKLANRRVFKASEAREEYTGMGSTAAAVMLRDNRMTFGSIGDSRIYLCGGGDMVQLTEDDTWGNRLRTLEPRAVVDSMSNSPIHNVLTKVLGVSDQTDLEVRERELNGHGRVLLCSDGLHNTVPAPELRRILSDHHDVLAAVEALIRAALEGGGRDNITVVLLEYSV